MIDHFSPRNNRRGSRRSFLLLVVLALALFALAACGGREQREAPPTPTAIVTLAAIEAPTATPEPEPTDTPEPETTEDTEEVDAGEVLTDTEMLTDTEGLTGTEAMTGTEAITGTESVSPSESVTDSEALTDSEEMTGTEEITGTEELTATDEVTATEDVSEGEEITETEGLTDTQSLTGTQELTGVEEVTSTGVVTDAYGEHQHGPTEPMTGTMSGGTASGTEATVPRLYFVHPTENAILPIPATVAIGAEGIDFDEESNEESNPLYLIVDAGFVAAGEEVPENALYQRVEGAPGETPVEVEVTMITGTHTLRAQVVDADGIAMEGDEYRAEIVVRALADAPEQSVRIAMPSDGATVPPTFEVVMAATGLIVEAAGVPSPDAGHLHLLVDSDFIESGQTMPLDATHLHFETGAITTELTLEPGEHVLRLQFADGAHSALEGDEYRDEITVFVEEGAPAQQVMFTSPEDGATVSETFTVTWAAAGLIIEQAGPVLRDNAGHLHLLIDEEFSPPNQVVANDATHIHYGLGETSTKLTLEPGTHTLRLQMANGAHFALGGEQYQDEITITVE